MHEGEFFQNNDPSSEMSKIAQRIRKFCINFKSDNNQSIKNKI